MAYLIPSRRAKKAAAVAVDHFPALCTTKKTQPVLDFTQLSFEDEIVPVPERRFEPGWVRLSYHEGKVRMETDYVVREPTLDALANKAILQMKARWVKFYTDRGMEPYDYDYVPYEHVEDDSSEEESSVGEDPNYDSE